MARRTHIFAIPFYVVLDPSNGEKKIVSYVARAIINSRLSRSFVVTFIFIWKIFWSLERCAVYSVYTQNISNDGTVVSILFVRSHGTTKYWIHRRMAWKSFGEFNILEIVYDRINWYEYKNIYCDLFLRVLRLSFRRPISSSVHDSRSTIAIINLFMLDNTERTIQLANENPKKENCEQLQIL